MVGRPTREAKSHHRVTQRGLWFEESEDGTTYGHRPGRAVTEADNVMLTLSTLVGLSVAQLTQGTIVAKPRLLRGRVPGSGQDRRHAVRRDPGRRQARVNPDVRIADGDTVEEGHVLGTMEAMKMELSLKAPFAGTVVEVDAVARAVADIESCDAKPIGGTGGVRRGGSRSPRSRSAAGCRRRFEVAMTSYAVDAPPTARREGGAMTSPSSPWKSTCAARICQERCSRTGAVG